MLGLLPGPADLYAIFGVLNGDHTFDHHSAMLHPWPWAFLHGAAVLMAATFQVIGWRLTENEERRAEENLSESDAQLTVAFERRIHCRWSPRAEPSMKIT